MWTPVNSGTAALRPCHLQSTWLLSWIPCSCCWCPWHIVSCLCPCLHVSVISNIPAFSMQCKPYHDSLMRYSFRDCPQGLWSCHPWHGLPNCHSKPEQKPSWPYNSSILYTGKNKTPIMRMTPKSSSSGSTSKATLDHDHIDLWLPRELSIIKQPRKKTQHHQQ